MRRLLALLLLLALAAGAHEGHDHEDLRNAPPPLTGTPLVVTRNVQAGEMQLVVTFRQIPAAPVYGQEIQVELGLIRKLVPPDPILGEQMAMQDATVTARLDGQDLGAVPAEDPPEGQDQAGWYVIHLMPSSPGRHTLTFQVANPDPFELTWEVAVARPLPRRLAEWAAYLVLAVVVGSAVVRRKLAPVPSLVGAALAAGLLAWAFLAPLPAPPPLAPPREMDSEEGLVIPKEVQQALQMTVEPVTERTLPVELTVPGQLRVPDLQQHTLAAPFTARVLTPPVRVGARVRRGEVLVELEEVLSSADQVTLRGQTLELEARRLEFETTRMELQRQTRELEGQRREAASRLSQRQVELKRAESLYAIQVIPKKDLEAARFAVDQARLELAGLDRQLAVVRKGPPIPSLPNPIGSKRYTLTSPIDGVVAQSEMAQDELVEPGKTLLRLVDLSTLWVEARVPESAMARVKSAGRAEVRTEPYPGPFTATFVSFGPEVDPETKTAPVLFALSNPEGRFLAGMSVRVTFSSLSEKLLTVPAEAVLEQDGESRVFVQLAPDRFEARTVEVQRRERNLAAITGLEAGTKVVVQGAGTLSSELARRSKER